MICSRKVLTRSGGREPRISRVLDTIKPRFGKLLRLGPLLFRTVAPIMVAASGAVSAADSGDDRTKIEILFDDGYMTGVNLADQEQFGWQRIAAFASPEVRQDGAGRPGAFSTGEETRAILATDELDASSKPVRLEFVPIIPVGANAHHPSFVQVGLFDGPVDVRGVPNPVITISAMGLLCGRGIAIDDPEIQKAYRNGALYKPTPGKTIHVRSDFDLETNTASISVSEDGGESYEQLSSSESGAAFDLKPFSHFNGIYLRLGSSTATGISSIVVSQ